MIIALLPVSANAASKGKGPVLHLRFDESSGSTAYDDGWTDTDSDGIKDSGESWNNNDGTLTPGATGDNTEAGQMWSRQGKIGSTLECDGTNDYVDVPISSSLQPQSELTLEAWIKPNSTQVGDIIILGEGAYYLTYTSDARVKCYWYGKSPSGYHTTAADAAPRDEWSHIAAVWSTTTVKIYVNGIEKFSTGCTGTGNTASNQVWIGAENDGGTRQFKGLIDNVRIYDYGRTATQIKTDYNAGMATYSGAGVDPIEGNPPVGYWKFDENTGTTVYDRSGNGNDGTFVNSPSWVQGKHGTALDFNGSNEYINCGNDSSIDMTTNDFTVEAWIYLTKMNVGILSKNAWQNGNYSIGFDDNQDNIYAHCIDQSGTQVHTDGALDFAPTYYNKWVHFAFVADRSGTALGHLYINGQEVSSYKRQESFSGVGSLSNTEPLYIGRFGSWYWDDKLDEVKIYKYARTQAQIAYDYNKGRPVAHYRFDEGGGTIAHNSESSANTGVAPVGWWKMDEGTGTACADSSGNGLTATASAATWSSNSKIGPYGLNNTYATVTDNALLEGMSSLTMSAWVYPTALAGTDRHIIDKGNWDSSPPMSYRLMYQTDWGSGEGYPNGYWRFNIKTSVGTYNADGPNGVSANRDNMWHYIVGVYDGVAGKARIYDNGILIGETNASGTINTNDYDTRILLASNGIVDDVRIYDYARTDAEIYNDYKSTHGTFVGDATFADGKIGKALSLDGTGDYVTTPYTRADLGTYYSMSAWFKYTGTAGRTYSAIIGGWERGGGGTEIFLGKNTGNTNIGWQDGSYYGSMATGTSAFDGNWHFITCTMNNTEGKLYLDGALLNTQTFSVCNASESVCIGTETEGGGYPWLGYIDDVKIYNYVRTAAQVSKDYNAGLAVHTGAAATVTDPWGGAAPWGHWKMDENTGVLAHDSSGNGRDGTLVGDTTWAQGKKGPCLSFDDNADYLTIPTLDVDNGAFTFSAWIYPNDLTSRHLTGTSSTWTRAIYLYNATRINFCSYDTAGTTTNIDLTASLQVSTWQHITVTRDGSGNLKCYLNGVDVTSGTPSAPYDWYTTRIGMSKTTAPTTAFDGKIDDARLYNYARTPAQIAWDYNKGKPVAHYRFDEATSGAALNENLYDDSAHANNGLGKGTGGPTWVAGKFGGALSFGGDDYVEAPDDPSLEFLYNDFTISLWFKTSDTSGGEMSFVCKYDPGYQLQMVGNKVRILLVDSIDGYIPHTVDLVINDGVWHNLVFIADRSTNTGYPYIDGVAYPSFSIGTGSYDAGGRKFSIGSRYTSRYFIGSIDDVRVYNYGRTAEQITQDYNQGMAAKLSD